MTLDNTMNLHEKEKKAVEVLKTFEPEEGYYLCYSGGKDSDVIRILADLAGVKHELHHNLTTVDAPETIQYIKSIPGVIIEKARYSDGSHKTMWNLIVKNGIPPTRLMRYCCKELKEHGGKGRLKITGVRKEESINRANNSGDILIVGSPKTTKKFLDKNEIEHDVTKKGGIVLNFDNSDSRRSVEHCYRTTSTMINPIIDWTEKDVYSFLHYYGVSINPLYSCGECRVGCVGCPQGGHKKQKIDFITYPKYKENYIRAFDRMLKVRIEKGNPSHEWSSGEEVMNWWIYNEKY